MTSRSAVRDALEALLDGLDVQVHSRAVTGTPAFPLVVFGMPDVDCDTDMCFDTWRFPVAVVAARPGSDDVVTVDRLESATETVLDQLRSELGQDPTLGGVAAHSRVARVDPGAFPVGQATHPANRIIIEITARS